MTSFTDVGIRSLPVPARGQRAYWDESLPTFGIRISQGGSRTFILKTQNRFITIGRFPLLSLSQARTEAKRLLAEITLGRHRPQSLSYAGAVQLYLEDRARGRRPRTVRDYARLLGRLSFGQIATIDHAAVVRALKTITAPSEYNHVLVAARIFFNWCLKRQYIAYNPTIGLATHATPSRPRLLTDEEVRLIWKATDEETDFNAIVRLLILTGQRRTEISSLKCEYIKDDICTLPATLTKNKREHSFPLSELSLSIVSKKNSGLLFTARGTQSRPFNGFSKAKVALDRRLVGTVAPWTLHDLRRYFASTMARLGVKQEVTERLLNHRSGIISGIAAVYTLHDFLLEMRAAVDSYQRHIEKIIKDCRVG